MSRCLHRLLAAPLLLGLGLVGGCGNACQATCRSMADAAVDCGFTVPEDQIDACVERQSGATGDDVKACRAAGPESIQWTCDDLALYFGGGAEA